MARIREYTNKQEVDPSPYGRLADTQASSGYRIGQAYAQLGNTIGDTVGAVAKAVDNQDDMNKAMLELPMLQAKLNVSYKERLQTEGSNKDFPDKFIADVDQQVGKLREQLTSDRALYTFDKAAESMKANFYEMVHADRVQITQQNTVNSYLQSVNLIEANIRDDPSSFEFQRQMSHSLLEAAPMDPGLKAKAVAENDRRFANAALESIAERDPAAARKALKDKTYAQYLGDGDSERVANAADRAENAIKSDEKAAQLELRRVQTDEFQRQMSELNATLFKEDGTEVVTDDYFRKVEKLAKHPAADPGTISAARNAAQAILRRQEEGTTAKTDPATYENLRSRLAGSDAGKAPVTQQELYEAQAAGKLSTKDMAFFSSWTGEKSRDPQRAANQKALDLMLVGTKKFITKSTLFSNDAQGEFRYLQFQQDMQVSFDKGIAAGKTADQLLRPNSPDYIGATVSNYMLTKEQSMKAFRDQVSGTGKPLPPVKPGAPGPVAQKATRIQDVNTKADAILKARGRAAPEDPNAVEQKNFTGKPLPPPNTKPVAPSENVLGADNLKVIPKPDTDNRTGRPPQGLKGTKE